MPYCPFCGSEVSDDDAFCRSCGAMLSSGTTVSKPPDGSRKIKIIAIVMVGVILVSAFAGMMAYATSRAVIDDLENDLTWDYGKERFTYKLTIARSDYNRMMDSDIDKSGTVSSGRYVIDGSVTFGVCDYVVVDKYVKKVSDDLVAMYKERFGAEPNNDEYVDFVTAFVQESIDYDYDEGDGGYENWRYPLETLYEGTGDCEDTSILLAALIDARGLVGGVILAPGHAMCAVGKDSLSKTYPNLRHSPVDYKGDGTGVYFYPIETTFNEYESIGVISDSMTAVYMHLYLGSVDDYYFSS